MSKIKDTITGENPKDFYTKSVENLSNALDKETPIEVIEKIDEHVFNAIKNLK